MNNLNMDVYYNTDSYTYYEVGKKEILKETNFPNPVNVGNSFVPIIKTVWGLNIEKQKNFFNALCLKICQEYRQDKTSPFVRKMQEEMDRRAESGYTLSPFELSVLREANERYKTRSYEGLNIREFERSVYIPHINKNHECYWHEESIYEPWTQRKIARIEIFDLENDYQKNLTEKQFAANAVRTPSAPENPDSSSELREAQAKIKELQEQIRILRKSNESERESLLNGANEEAARIKTEASVEAEKILAQAKAQAEEIKAEAQEAAAEAEAKAQTVFKNKIAQKIVKQRNLTRDANIDSIKSDVKKYYAKPVDLSKNNSFVEKSASDLQNIFSAAMNDALEKLKAEKTQMYEQMDKVRHDLYPSKEKLCIKWYLDYYGTWNKTADTVIAALLASIEANKDKNIDVDPDDKIANNLVKLSGMLEKFLVEFENAIAALGFEVFRPQPGDLYDSNYHRCSDQSDEDDTDDFNKRKIISCKKPGIKRIGLSGNVEVLEFAEVVIEE